MAFVLHRGADLTAIKLSSEYLPNLDGWLLGVEKSVGFILNYFSHLAPGFVSAGYLGSLESHQEMRRREKHYQSVMQILRLRAYFRIG